MYLLADLLTAAFRI